MDGIPIPNYAVVCGGEYPPTGDVVSPSGGVEMFPDTLLRKGQGMRNLRARDSTNVMPDQAPTNRGMLPPGLFPILKVAAKCPGLR
ncbi:MAG: hypothetical protein OHK0012_03740 [Synechococcales cyanobacterium]